MPTEIAELIFEANTSQLTAANQELGRLNSIAPKVQSNIGRMASSFKVQSNAAQVAAFQIQDFAVQVGSGQSAMTAFTQQAPQFLGVFGAGGAILGTIVAITSAIAGPLITQMFAAEDSADLLDEAMKKLSDTFKITKDGTVLLSEEFAILANKSRDIAEVQLKARLITAAAATNAAFVQLSETVEDFDFYLAESGRAIRGNSVTIANLAKEYGVTSKELMMLRDLQKTAFDSKSIDDANALAQAITNISIAGGGTTDKFTELADATNKVVMQLNQQKQISDLAKNSLANLDQQLATNSETAIKAAEEQEKINERAKRIAEQQERIRKQEQDAAANDLERLRTELMTAEQLIEASYNKRSAIISNSIDRDLITKEAGAELERQLETKKAESIAKIQEQELQKQKDVQAANINATGDLFTALATLTAGEGKKSFERSKKLAIAGAVIKGIQATVNAYEEGSKTNIYVGAAYAAIAAATTGAQIAQIKGQQYAGRALGGQVRPGESYRVGEYGPETLVMGSNGGTIVPKGAANDSGSSVIVNVTVEGGSGNETVERSKSTDNQGRLIENIIVKMANDKTSGLMKGVFANSTAMPRGSR